MIEVLVTVVILAFGLLGLAALQLRMQAAELESFQRAQALVLLNDMVNRIQANRPNAANYAPSTLGNGATIDCSGTPTPGSVLADQCQWSNLLLGESEGIGIGAMVGARGCITQVIAANPASGVCTPATYEIAVAWQGLNATASPVNTCGEGEYGTNEALRRVISTRIVLGLFGCS